MEKRAPTAEALRERLIETLRRAGALHDPEVERALRSVPRHLFLPESSLDDAYANVAVATHWEDGVAVSSASQPAIVAVMLQQLQPAPGMRVLEIGAGTGYNAALLAELVGPAGQVTTLDIDPVIVAEAKERLAAAGYERVEARAVDGAQGWPANAPYDRVILTVGASDIVPAWFDQLAEEGMLVAPLSFGIVEVSVAFRKRAGALHSESLAPCGFIRLRGQEANALSRQQVEIGSRWLLIGEHAQALAEPVARLLETRPRRRLIGRAAQAMLPYLATRGHELLLLWSVGQHRTARRAPGRYGLYVGEEEGGPSLALFPRGALPLLITFGSDAAERRVRDELARAEERSRRAGATYQPLDAWRISAHLRRDGELASPPPGVMRIERRHAVFDIATEA